MFVENHKKPTLKNDSETFTAIAIEPLPKRLKISSPKASRKTKNSIGRLTNNKDTDKIQQKSKNKIKGKKVAEKEEPITSIELSPHKDTSNVTLTPSEDSIYDLKENAMELLGKAITGNINK